MQNKEQETMTAIAKNIIRTATPAIVGAVVAWITNRTAHISPATTAIVFPIATTLYYSTIRGLETRYPKLSWLLGALPVPTTVHHYTITAAPAVKTPKA
jgi:hypothetical protein